jgi:uncharacterized membrane protein
MEKCSEDMSYRKKYLTCPLCSFVGTVNKFGSKDKSTTRRRTAGVDEVPGSPSPTLAIVTLNFAIDGDATNLPVIRSRNDLRTALSKISSDARVSDCLITAEILWSPEDPAETLSRETAYSDFPFLVPI